MIEELFFKLFPEYVVNGKPLSPYFDLFESGYEQAENRIEELEKQIEKMKNCRNCKKFMIEGVCGHFLQVGWCKNWELRR